MLKVYISVILLITNRKKLVQRNFQFLAPEGTKLAPLFTYPFLSADEEIMTLTEESSYLPAIIEPKDDREVGQHWDINDNILPIVSGKKHHDHRLRSGGSRKGFRGFDRTHLSAPSF